MFLRELAVCVGITILGSLAVFQILLALGLPLGRAAWGGQHRVLPVNRRWGSLFAVAILSAAGWILLARAGIVAPGPGSMGIRVAAWAFAGYFGLNILMNLFSRSPVERAVMTPVSVLLFASYLTVLLVRA